MVPKGRFERVSRSKFFYNLEFCFIFRQFTLAHQDLVEALKLSPANREIRRLLVRVKEESQGEGKLEPVASMTSLQELEKAEMPDIVPELRTPVNVIYERREETAL